MNIFYDTNALLNKLNGAFNEHFFISNITLKELENIKTSASKDPDIKFRARRLIRLLADNQGRYTVVNYKRRWDALIRFNPALSDNNDSRIIICALKTKEPDLIFITQDLCCQQLAISAGLNVKYQEEENEDYTGYAEVEYKGNEELAKIYDNLFNGNPYQLKINQYLLIKHRNSKEVIDKYKYTSNGLTKVPFSCYESKMFGKIKPKDEYQALAMDSLASNQVTLLRGPAGSGKSYLALGYLFSQLEKHKIDKIIIFCNTVATAGSAKLGFYPGTREQKLLDSQIGNFLASKFGDKAAVEKMIADGDLELLPVSDIRGYDTSGMNAGIYITEAQNLDIELMRLALQRIGEDSICILDGDDCAQVDLPLYAGDNNGMRRVSKIFRGDSIYGEVTLKTIHRSHIAELAQLM